MQLHESVGIGEKTDNVDVLHPRPIEKMMSEDQLKSTSMMRPEVPSNKVIYSLEDKRSVNTVPK